MTIRIAIGISHPAGKSRTFSDHGRNFCTDTVSHVFVDTKARQRKLTSTTASCLIVMMTVKMPMTMNSMCHAGC
jgi:hypothetical protein